jgi:GT2 family glycosyltransferase
MISPTEQFVYIIIPVHNRKQITIACLENLNTCGDLQKYRVIVVDDGSKDGTAEAIREQYPMVEILTGDGNLWWMGAIAV